MTMAADGAGSGLGLEQLIGMLGINWVCGQLKQVMKEGGFWVDENPVKRHYFFAPFVVATAACWLFEKQPPGLVDGIVSAAKCGGVYAVAALVLYNFKRTSVDGR